MKKQTEANGKEEGKQVVRLRKSLLAWYGKHQRDLPWRGQADPYRIWLSEVMLQQTQVETVIPYYRRFLKRFPDLSALAEADLAEVLKSWENLGYYARARNLHRAARVVAKAHGGRIPDDPGALMALPGIGPYSAGAILSMAYGKRFPAVDGNVKRVLARLYLIRAPLSDRETHGEITRLAESLVPADRPGDFNQALMDLGATLCTPGVPLCGDCPLKALCLAFKSGAQSSIPPSMGAKALPERNAAAALILSGRSFLIIRRPHEGLLGGLWKLPGGFALEGESIEEALKRTAREETGLRIATLESAATVRHAFTHFRMTLHGFHCTVRGKPPTGSERIQWIVPSDASDYAFGKADRELINRMIRLLSA